MSVKIHTHAAPEPELLEPPRQHARPVRLRQPRSKPSHADRLLRNSAVACALLLGILALGNIDQPWAQKASEGIERALTMHIDLDETIGSLTFVRQIVPESALVFLNLSGETALTRPVAGDCVHPWTNVQPWLMFGCEHGDPVSAAGAGTVTAVSPMTGGKYGVLIDHGTGVESVYANLSAVDVAAGDAVERGQQIGASADGVYYEYRSGGTSMDPTELLGI